MDYFKILTSKEDLEKYRNYDLFYYTDGKYILFKSKLYDSETLKIPVEYSDNLYIRMCDRISAVRNRQRFLNKELTQSIKVDVPRARKAILNIVDNLLSEPKSLVLRESARAVNIIVEEYLDNPMIIENLTQVALHDYSTSLHLVNCMLLCLGYAQYNNFPKEDMKLLGMSGLMHDLGKVDIPDYILQSSRKLTDEEFDIIKLHPTQSRKMLLEAKFSSVVIKAAYEHHERIDGTGYPKGKVESEISEYGKILAIIDMYEALTHWRPYKNAMAPIDALKMIKIDIDNGRLSKEHFINFTKSIVGKPKY